MKIKSLIGMAILPIALGVSATTFAAGELKIINWAEYIGESTISDFAKEFDIKVTYDSYDSTEAINSKMLTGDTGYDVVLNAGASISRLIQADILMEIDKSKLPNLKNMRPDILAQLDENWDKGNKYTVPNFWGTHGVTYNEALIKSVHPEAPIGSLDLMFDPKHMKKLSSCGVAFLDSPEDIIPMALSYLGLDPNSENAADYKAVGKMLSKIRPYIKTFGNYAYQQMPTKEFCAAITWGPDGLLAMSGAADANTGVELDFFLPPGDKGAQLWVEGWTIPSDAKNVENAHLFMNYLMRPQVAANDTNFTWYASSNKAAFDLIDTAVTGNNAAYPTAEQVSKMYTYVNRSKKISRIQTRVWTKFKMAN